MQTQERDRVVAKIQALTKKTVSNGCTEAEAMQAMEKVDELLEAFNLSMTDVILSQTECVTETFETKRKQQHPMASAYSAVAEFCDCIIWIESGSKDYKLFGLEQDTQLATYLMEVIDNAYKTELKKFKRSKEYRHATCHRRRLTCSFYRGMASGLADRLRKMKRERDEKYRSQHDALEVKSTDIIVAKEKKINDEFKKTDIKLKKTTRYSRAAHHSSYSQGHNASKNVNLNRPIDSGGQRASGYLT